MYVHNLRSMNRNIYVATKEFSIRRYLFVVLSDKGLKL